MNFHVLTLFPEVLEPYFQASILGRAQKARRIHISCHPLREYARNKHRAVDDRPYGGGAGMVFCPEVVVDAVRDLKQRFSIDRVCLLSPRGYLLNQERVRQLTQYASLLLICGRYEGVDQRAIDLVVDEEISIGDYVITGGELAAQIVVDAVARLIPGVVGDAEGPLSESHADGLLEYPQYTRPEVFEGQKVPEVLMSGNHAAIEKWRHEESLQITRERRPDLIKKAQ